MNKKDLQNAIDRLISNSGFTLESEDAYEWGYLDALADIYLELGPSLE